ncbi:MAG: molecular chaperone DnaJ [Promicromonosporaceae bacterium]|nr:molecular chaperone DnaJ [Promicromonosporaceae bacterium]
MADYYSTLGVSKTASVDEIKKAYRRLARECHPDVAGAAGEERFKAVSAAYEVLSNPETRQQFDRGIDPLAPGGGAGAGGFGFGAGGFGFGDIFETFFGGGGGTSGPVPRVRRGQDSLFRLNIDLATSVFGGQEDLTIDTAVACTTCTGTGCQPGTGPQTCSACGGRGHVQRVARSFLGQVMTTAECAQCRGHGTVIPSPCPECQGEGRIHTRRQVKVNVPAGVDTGTRIRLASQGEVGPGAGPAGDLYVEIFERPHGTFVRQGDDLLCTMQVPMTAAALGATLNLDTLDGPQEVDLLPGTQPGATVALKGLGVGRLRRDSRGDLRVNIEVEVPTRLSDEQRDLLQQLAAARGEEKPQPRLADANPSVFSRLKDKLAGK